MPYSRLLFYSETTALVTYGINIFPGNVLGPTGKHTNITIYIIYNSNNKYIPIKIIIIYRSGLRVQTLRCAVHVPPVKKLSL